jgi:hypothetical protein
VQGSTRFGPNTYVEGKVVAVEAPVPAAEAGLAGLFGIAGFVGFTGPAGAAEIAVFAELAGAGGPGGGTVVGVLRTLATWLC